MPRSRSFLTLFSKCKTPERVCQDALSAQDSGNCRRDDRRGREWLSWRVNESVERRWLPSWSLDYENCRLSSSSFPFEWKKEKVCESWNKRERDAHLFGVSSREERESVGGVGGEIFFNKTKNLNERDGRITESRDWERETESGRKRERKRGRRVRGTILPWFTCSFSLSDAPLILLESW